MAYTGPIDVDRGVMVCTHKPSGMNIYMYLDSPGIYLDDHAKEVPETLARTAGFPVERFAKEKVRNFEMEKVRKTLEETLNIREHKTIYAENGRYRVIQIADSGMAIVETDDGPLTKQPVALQVAMILFNELVGEAATAAPPPTPETAKTDTKGKAAMKL